MALSSALSAANPFRITGTPMPPNLLLLCKILAVAVLATGHIAILPEPFLPFIPVLDQLVEPAVFRRTVQIVATAAALALLCNRWVRASAMVFGACFLLAVLSSRAYYGNNKTFTGLLLVLAALSDFDRPAYLLRWQLSLTYFGAALNKLLEPDWQSGLFFDFWGAAKIRDPLFVAARAWLPPLMAGKLMCWGTIVAEFAVALGLFVPMLVPLALWLNALFQVGLVQFTGGTFTLFFYAMQAVALAFIVWPRRVTVIARSPRPLWLGCLDPDGLHDWRLGDSSLTVAQGTSTYRGVAAVCRLLILSPVFWLLATALLASADQTCWRQVMPIPAAAWRRGLVLAILLIVVTGCFRRRMYVELAESIQQ